MMLPLSEKTRLLNKATGSRFPESCFELHQEGTNGPDTVTNLISCTSRGCNAWLTRHYRMANARASHDRQGFLPDASSSLRRGSALRRRRSSRAANGSEAGVHFRRGDDSDARRRPAPDRHLYAD